MFEKSIINIMVNHRLTGADSETRLMSEEYGNTPPPICFTYASPKSDGSIKTLLAAKADKKLTMKDSVRQAFEYCFENDGKIVFQNAAFDLGVIANEWPDLLPLVFRALDEGHVHCTLIREKFLNLAEFGELDMMTTRQGAVTRFGYGLDDLVKKYLHMDISEDKHASDSWRTNYQLLEDQPKEEWPDEAVRYAEMDAAYVLPIYAYQEERATELESRNRVHPFAAEALRMKIAFGLGLMSAAGMCVDPEKSVLLDQFLTQDLDPAKLNAMFDADKGLVDHGILIPWQPPKPYAKKTLDHQPGCIGHKEHPEYKKSKKVADCGCPVKMKKAVEERIDKKKLIAYMEALAEVNEDIKIRRGEPTDAMIEKAAKKGEEAIGNIKTDNAWFDEFADKDPVLQQYQYRAKGGKIRSDYIKKLFNEEGEPVHTIRACFDILKRSGRVSSYGGKLFPSWNCQNVDPRIRPVCYAPEGWLLLSSDYNAMELGTAAQTCINVVGYSVMADVINAGKDVHSYLGARIAYETEPDFKMFAHQEGADDPESLYNLFMSMKSSDEQELQSFFKKYRKFAKPTGLGYPGGLGPKTFVTYAKQTFWVEVDIDTATRLREIWRETFPEFPEYHKHITQNCEDYVLGPVEIYNKKTEKYDQMKKYKYVTPMGMMRPGCDFTKIANGMCMQSPSSEGSLMAGYDLVKESFNPESTSILKDNCIPLAPIHDEYLCYIQDNEDKYDVIEGVEKIMVDNMRVITPDVKAGVESALMKTWYKEAEPVFDENGKLDVWYPDPDNPDHKKAVWIDKKIAELKGE